MNTSELGPIVLKTKACCLWLQYLERYGAFSKLLVSTSTCTPAPYAEVCVTLMLLLTSDPVRESWSMGHQECKFIWFYHIPKTGGTDWLGPLKGEGFTTVGRCRLTSG